LSDFTPTQAATVTFSISRRQIPQSPDGLHMQLSLAKFEDGIEDDYMKPVRATPEGLREENTGCTTPLRTNCEAFIDAAKKTINQ